MSAAKYPAFSARRPLVCVALAYGAGIFAASLMAFRPLYGLAGLALSFVFFAFCRTRRVLALAGAFFFFGLLYAGYALSPVILPPGSYQIEGYVSGEARETRTGRVAAMLKDVTLVSEAGESYRAGKLYWSFTPKEDEPFLPVDGRRVAFTGRLYEPSPQMNPYGFDYRLYLLTQGVSAGVSGAKEITETGASRLTFSGVMLRARQAIEREIDLLFGEDAALPKALLLGVRDELPEDVIEQFGQSGITHILAVSGLHVGLLAGILLALLRLLTLPRGARLAVMTVFLFAYCALLGFSAPVLRASILFLTAAIGKMRLKRRDSLTLLATAFFVILLFRPLDLFSVSFQLSFLAVLGIILLYNPFSRALGYIKWGRLRDALAASLAAILSTALPAAASFHRLSVIGLIVSPAVCALLAPLLLCDVLALVAGAISLPLGQAVAVPARYLARAMTFVAEKSAELPFAAFNVPAPNAVYFAFALALALSLTTYVLWRLRTKIILCACLLVCALTVDMLSVRREVRYIQFSVGQEDAALLIDGRETVLIDTSASGGDPADYLLSTGLTADTVILTHLHSDHCMGLADLIKARVPVGRVLLPEGAEEAEADEICLRLLEAVRAVGIPVIPYAAGDMVKTARATVTALWSERGKTRPGEEANLYAAAFLIESGGARLLVMSDTDGRYERYAAVPADILKVAHHGSAGATSEAFLDIVSPACAIISCGAANASLPAASLLERLQASVPSVYRTDVSGAITIVFGENGATVTPYR